MIPLTAAPRDRIRSEHRDRLAVVYIRQSTPQQVERHQESGRLQYGLVDHAIALGWPRERILVIDEDQGTRRHRPRDASASSASWPRSAWAMSASCSAWRCPAWPARAATGTSCSRSAPCAIPCSGTAREFTIPLLDTPIRPKNARSKQITITDPAHPLYGRSFPLISVSGSRHGNGHAYVDDRGRAVLRIPIEATSLRPAPPACRRSKLSLEAIRDLVQVASREDGIRRPNPQAAASPGRQADAEPSSTIPSPSSGG